MSWYYIMDMHSGGTKKTRYEMFFVEAEDQYDAEARFTAETGEDPDDVACQCCGPNFSVGGPYSSLEEATEFWRRGKDMDEYLKNPGVKTFPLPSITDML